MIRRFFALLILVAMALSATASAQLPDIMYLKFNEGTGSTTADFAVPGIGTACTFQATAGFNTTSPVLGAACFQAGTTNPFSQVNTNANVNVSGDWTLEFYCQWAGGSTIPAPSVFHDGTSIGLRCYVGTAPGAPNYSLHLRTSSLGHQVNLTSVIVPNVWVHFAFVHDSTTNTITSYVDGVFKQSDNFTTPAILQSLGGPLYIGGEPVTSTWGGLIDEVRIWNSARTAGQVLANYNQEVSGYLDNLSVDAITSPVAPMGACASAGSAETVSVSVSNGGSNTIPAATLIPIDLVVDGGSPVTEFIFVPAGGLVSGAAMPFTFTATADLSAVGLHTIDVTAVLPLDQNAGDDTASVSILSGGPGQISSFPYVENFDSQSSGSTTPPVGWEQETTDSSGTNSDWIFLSGAAGTASTSPSGDHSSGGGIYAYVEDSGAELSAVSLRSPCIDLSGLANPHLSFWFHSQDASAGVNTNPMSIDVITQPAGTVTMDVFGPQGNIGNGWMSRLVNLQPFAGQTIQLVFRGRSDGGTAKNDTAIDDLRIFDLVVTNGQAPVAGTAVLDINSAVDSNGAAVGSLTNGPYFASALGGGTLTFDFSGELNRPFALLIGPLNPVAATYPNVGQLDIGGAVDPMTGVPSMIQVLGDGFNPVTFLDFLFNTGPSGSVSMNFTAPVLPPGIVGTFQTLFSSGNGFFFGISNAVELTIN